jgi:hypothetical protein
VYGDEYAAVEWLKLNFTSVKLIHIGITNLSNYSGF